MFLDPNTFLSNYLSKGRSSIPSDTDFIWKTLGNLLVFLTSPSEKGVWGVGAGQRPEMNIGTRISDFLNCSYCDLSEYVIG